LALAEQNGLVRLDPRQGQVYLSPHLAAKQGGADEDVKRPFELKPSDHTQFLHACIASFRMRQSNVKGSVDQPHDPYLAKHVR
jgi:hypothetical protein